MLFDSLFTSFTKSNNCLSAFIVEQHCGWDLVWKEQINCRQRVLKRVLHTIGALLTSRVLKVATPSYSTESRCFSPFYLLAWASECLFLSAARTAQPPASRGSWFSAAAFTSRLPLGLNSKTTFALILTRWPTKLSILRFEYQISELLFVDHEQQININEKLLERSCWLVIAGLFCWLVVIQWRHVPAVGGKSWRNSGKRPLGWMTHAQKSMLWIKGLYIVSARFMATEI